MSLLLNHSIRAQSASDFLIHSFSFTVVAFAGSGGAGENCLCQLLSYAAVRTGHTVGFIHAKAASGP